MRKLLSAALALTMAGSMFIGDVGVASAQNRESFENRQSYRNDWRGSNRYYRGDRHWRGDRDWRRDRRHWRGRDRGDALAAGAAGLVTGAIIGGVIANQQGPRRIIRSGGSSHVEWCYDRYRSYRASDNTFQPYNGPRRQCYSPYS